MRCTARRAASVAALALCACRSSQAPAVVSTVAVPKASAAPSASTAPAQPADAGAEDSAGARETRLVARMLRHVETARGLESKRPVPGVLLDRHALIAQVREHVSRELPSEAIVDEGLELALLGFIPTQFDYEGAEYALLQDQLAGYYEPADGTMYMASDLDEEAASETLAHELVHALQDQRWNLADRSKYVPGQGDRSEAVSALAEGDATSAMLDVVLARTFPGKGMTAIDLPDEEFAKQIRSSMATGPGASAPHIMRTSLVAPYIYGTLFVNALRRQGGWSSVDHAWDDPPATSEQILHVEKWASHEPAIAIAAPTFRSLTGDWKVVDEDSEGELGVRLAFEEWMDAKAAADLSAGWGGDRGVLLRSGDKGAFAWRLRYDPGKTPGEGAARVWPALVKALDARLGATGGGAPAPAARSRGKGDTSTFVCHERSDRGPFAVARSEGDLIFVVGPASTGAGGWKSAGDCALARRWTREIASGH